MLNELEKIAYVYGDVCLRKQRRKRQKLLIAELFLDYAKNSTLHGLRYIAEKGLTLIEKLFWTVTFVISIILCSFLIKSVYTKWKYSPVIVTVNERLVSVGEVPFPSVTICPQIKNKASVYNLSEKIEYMMMNSTAYDKYNEELTMFADVSMVCNFEDNTLEFSGDLRNSSLINNIDYVAPDLEEVLINCMWHDIEVDCSAMFKKVYTAEGQCFNMNGMAAEEMFRDTVQKEYKYSERKRLTKGWSFEKGYSSDDLHPFPKRGSENGAKPDLEVILTNRDEDSDGICNVLNSGYKIYIQHPADYPQSSMYYYAALDGQVSSLAVSFHVLGTSEALEDYSTEIRQCYFPKDRQLHYFKLYTAKNCRAECLSNYTFHICDCVGYYMPHNDSRQLCAFNKLICMKRAHEYMVYRELQLELAKINEGCRCLPACNTVEYDAEILKTQFNLKKYLKNTLHLSDDNIIKTMKFSKMEMYFKKPQFVSMRRSELFGLTDFLANIGGLLGVFLGFSFLSLIEILYFATLRVGCSLRRDLQEEKKHRTNSLKILKRT